MLTHYRSQFVVRLIMTDNNQNQQLEMQQFSVPSLPYVVQEHERENEQQIQRPNDSAVTVTERSETSLPKKQTSKRWLCVFCLTSGSILLLDIILKLVTNESLVRQMMSLLHNLILIKYSFINKNEESNELVWIQQKWRWNDANWWNDWK